jgi:Ala-tRNA(Pro) deacylase
MTCNQKLEAYLHDQGVPFKRQQHSVAFTAHEVAASEHLPDDMVAKVVIVFADANMAMLVLPASQHVDLTKVAAELGAKQAWLANEHEFAAVFPDCDIGAMPPFGNLYDVPVYVDRTLTKDETIVFQAGTHTDTIRMGYANYARLAKPKVVDIVQKTPALANYFAT